MFFALVKRSMKEELKKLSIGVLAHLHGHLPYRQLAFEVGAAGFKSVQLAIWKAISDADFNQPGKLSPGLAMSIGEAFQRNGVSIAVLGCYLHYFNQDKDQLRVNMERCKELIRHARFMGAPTVGFEVGFPEEAGQFERDWKVLKASIEELSEEAEKWGAIVGLEAANGHLIETAPQLAAMLDEVPTSQLGVVLDPGNLLNAGNFHQQDEVIEEAFALLGKRIVAAHAKDLQWTEDGQLIAVAPGFGTMNYELYLRLLQQYKPGVHLTMEEAVTAEMREQSKQYIEDVFSRIQ